MLNNSKHINSPTPRVFQVSSGEAVITPLNQPNITSKGDDEKSTKMRPNTSFLQPLKPSTASTEDNDRTSNIIAKTSPQPVHKPNKYLVYMCDGSKMCAGWGDRQRFIVSVFFLAKVTGREFRLIMTTPCNITKFLVPNRYQWIPIGKELQSESKILVDLWDATMVEKFTNTFINGDFNVAYPQTVVYLKGNRVFHAELEKSKLYAVAMKPWPNPHRGFRWAWAELMSPSPDILQKLKDVVGSDLLIRRGLIKKDPRAPPNKEATHSHALTYGMSKT